MSFNIFFSYEFFSEFSKKKFPALRILLRLFLLPVKFSDDNLIFYFIWWFQEKEIEFQAQV